MTPERPKTLIFWAALLMVAAPATLTIALVVVEPMLPPRIKLAPAVMFIAPLTVNCSSALAA